MQNVVNKPVDPKGKLQSFVEHADTYRTTTVGNPPVPKNTLAKSKSIASPTARAQLPAQPQPHTDDDVQNIVNKLPKRRK